MGRTNAYHFLTSSFLNFIFPFPRSLGSDRILTYFLLLLGLARDRECVVLAGVGGGGGGGIGQKNG